MEFISSAQNPKIKRLLALQEKSRLRREEGIFVVEGRREVERCLGAGFIPEALFICPELAGSADTLPVPSAGGTKVFEVSREVYEKVAYRGGTEGIIAEVRSRSMALSDLPRRRAMSEGSGMSGGTGMNEGTGAGGRAGAAPLYIVLEGVEKPGNLGAVLRSADAAGANAVIVCDPLTDIWNPNLIRASLGAVFTVPIAICNSAEAISWLREQGCRILTAQLQDSTLYYDQDMTGATAIVIGTESTGLSDQWRQAASAHIRIPMLGVMDSLNASVSAAILLFEARRQRGV